MASEGEIGRGDSRMRQRGGASAPPLRRFPLLAPGAGERFANRLGDIRLALGAAFEREMEAGRGFLWLPVCFGIGILVYFALPQEPSASGISALALTLALATWSCRRRIGAFRTLLALTGIAAGLTDMKLRTDIIAAPVLHREMTTTVAGFIEAREATPTDGARVYLRVVSMSGLKPEETPALVRFTVRTRAGDIAVGNAVSVKARLQPPSGPVQPGAYDFGLVAFYEQLGAVGFAYGGTTPVDLGEAPLMIRIMRPLADLREAIRLRIVAALPGDNGRIAAALIMGDQGAIATKTQDDMRASGLGHVLSISGLHLAMVAGSVFWILRAMLALSVNLALTRPIKKWAAGGALAAAAFYVGLSGGGVATDRSFVMLAIMLIAVMLDRAALTLRNVALAAALILVAWPESLLSVSFQMSFAATLALVAGYEAFRDRALSRPTLVEAGAHGLAARFRRAVIGAVLTSVLAGLATAPFAAYHFQRTAPLTLFANLAAMPAIGLIIMPMALAAAILMPFGLEVLPLAVMNYGLDWMVLVATRTAEWSEGLGGVPMSPPFALLLFVVGFLWLALWRERWRLAGLIPLLVSIPVALLAPRPDILVSASGTAAAVRGADGRYQFIGATTAKFEVENWLRADADPRKPDVSDLADGVLCDALGCTARLADGAEVAVVSKPDALDEDCRSAAVIVTRFSAPVGCAAVATVVDQAMLALGGAQALFRLPAATPSKPSFRVEAAYPAIRRPYMPYFKKVEPGSGTGQ